MATPVAVASSEAALQKRIDRLAEVFPLPFQFPPELAPFTPDVLRRHGWLAGTPPQVAEQIQTLKEKGVNRVILHHLDVDDHESLELVAAEILPHV
jgi:alkanesulfonate monooxygenase SsuD/methylene tetrahydromethanopterin reductase-like flavin-dependent oxidoreductase (luciferase family)